MKILVGCEFSGTIRDIAREKGYEAFSIDFQDSKGKYTQYHIKDNILNHLNDGWDIMIAHPPCTYLCHSGEQWLTRLPKYKLNPNVKYLLERFGELDKASEFFLKLWNAPINKICLENPRMMTLALIKIGIKSSQKIQPYEFGHTESKETHLWLKNLPKLKQTNNVYKEMMKLPIQERQKIFYNNSKDRSNERSITYQGIADAMIDQWIK